MMKLWLLTLLVFALSACGQTQSELAGSSWTLQSYSPEDTQQNVLPDVPITLEISEASAGGSSGCNNYSGELTVKGNTFSLTSIVSTERACVEANLNQQEAMYLTLLQGVTAFEKTDTTLTLIAGEERLEFISK
jgi:heat shock protein HslJ